MGPNMTHTRNNPTTDLMVQTRQNRAIATSSVHNGEVEIERSVRPISLGVRRQKGPDWVRREFQRLSNGKPKSTLNNS